MSLKKALAIVLTMLVIFISFSYSFAAVKVKYNVNINGDMATVTSAVYGTSEEEAAGVTVSFEVYGGLNGFQDKIDKKASTTYDSYVDGFYKYVLETFAFPVLGDNYQCRVVYVGPSQPAPQVKGTVYLPDGKTPFTGGGLVAVNTEYDYFGDFSIKGDGTYSIGGLKDGTYNLRAIPGKKSKYSKSFNVEIKISGGKLISTAGPVNILLTDTQYSGTVVKPDGTTPFTEGWIDVMTKDRYFDNVQIGLDGSFTCGGLPDGIYYLQARPFDGSGDVCRSTEVEVAIRDGKLSSPTGVLKLTMSVPQFAGYVVSPDGNAIEYTGIEVLDGNNAFVDSAFSGIGGVFKFAGLSDGYYEIFAYEPCDSTYAVSDKVEIQISGGKLVGSSPVLKLGDPQVKGIVYLPDGYTSDVNSGVEVSDSYGKYFTGEQTDKTGEFNIGCLKDSIYTTSYAESQLGINLTPVDNSILKTLPMNSMNNLRIYGPVYEVKLESFSGSTRTIGTKFADYVKIELGVEGIDITKVNTKKLAVYYLDEATMKWKFAGGKYDAATGTITFKTNHFTKFAVMEYNKSFADVSSTNWAKEYIELLAARNITDGIDENNFDPKGVVTRAQFATFLVKALGIETTEYTGKFSDITKEKWYSLYVEAAERSGLVSGLGGGTFDPNTNITREQMAVMVMNAYKYARGTENANETKKATVKFNDEGKFNSWGRDAVYAAQANGIIGGMPGNVYSPKENAKREQAARVIIGLLELLGEI